jgi:triosephosphate isomerase
MLKAAGCTYVLVGHSERRQYFGESDDGVNRKTHAALESAIIPVVCIGETESEREAGQTFSVLDKQIRLGLEGVSLRGPRDLVVAYEPVWAIGTGKTATRDQAQEAHAFIREQLAKALGSDVGRRYPNSLRRQRKTRQRERADGHAGHRRRPGRRCQSET